MTRSILTLLFAATFAAAPLFTNPFSGFEANQLPIPQTDPPIQPAGWAFSIWGLIYAWLVVSALRGLWDRRSDAAWEHVRTPLIGALAIGTPWLWIANQDAIWATVTIFVMAGLAVAALMRAPARDRWWLRAPVAVFAGWLTAASFVSLGSTMAGYGVLTDALGWAWIGIGLAAVTAWMVQARTGEWLYGAAVGWALIGIAVANGTALPWVTAAAVAALALVALRATLSARQMA